MKTNKSNAGTGIGGFVGHVQQSFHSIRSGPIPERAAWGKPIQFVLSCLNYAVGIGNIWRFPYLVYRNGGGAFLIPYVIMLFIMGLPIFFLELIVGQYSGQGPNTAFMRMAPIFHGVGYSALAIVTMISIYYQVIVAWTIFYIFASFYSELGWGSCLHDYNTPDCYSHTADKACKENDTVGFQVFYNKTCRLVAELCEEHGLEMESAVACKNATGEVLPLNNLLLRVLSSEEYFNDYAMGRLGATWLSWGALRWEMVCCLLLAWIITYLCVMKGVASMGKVVYFTSIFPYCVLFALLIRGVTLPGAWQGIKFYITPKWELLLSAAVWGDAASQTFYALGIGCGSLVTLSSYNKFTNNCYRDAIFVAAVNLVTSVLAGFAVFAILGFMAEQMEVPVSEVVESGPGLAFVAYPEAVIQMPLPQIWAVLFFLMLCILGLGSQFAGVEGICTALRDRWPWLRKYSYQLTGFVCFTCFLLGLPMCFEGGILLFTVMDWQTASWAILIIGLVEVIAVAWFYGVARIFGNINEMGIRLHRFNVRYWKLMWVAVTPLSICAVIIFNFVEFKPPKYGEYEFPVAIDVLGWFIGIAALAPLPGFAIYQVVKNRNRQSDLNDLIHPTSNWGPQKSTHTIGRV